MKVCKVTLGTYSEGHEATVKSREKAVWVCNTPWPGFAFIEMPNGDVWDCCEFIATKKVNPWPMNEPCNIKIEYSGYVPPGYPPGYHYSICITMVTNGK